MTPATSESAIRTGDRWRRYHARMILTDLEHTLDDVLRDHRLLSHPFYRRWEAGTLAATELATYAAQYRYFEAALPDLLVGALQDISDPVARDLVQANLDDERGAPCSHLELFDAFAREVGAAPSAPTSATSALVATYKSCARRSSTAVLAAIAAYEVQSAEIASSKADGLRVHYGIGAEGTRFWDVHAGIDAAHGTWVAGALARIASDKDEVAEAAWAGSRAWWDFLDERQAAAV
jgi:pyrroloquinoline quinone (PQQ) biosynthesis protein C